MDEYALAIGNGLKERAKELGRYGADKVFLADDPSLEPFNADYYRQVALDVTKKTGPSIILAAATSTGKDLAPRLAFISTQPWQASVLSWRLITGR